MSLPIDSYRRTAAPLALAAALILVLAGCSKKAAVPAAPPGPTVAGERVTFPAGSPQLAFLSMEKAEPRRLAVSHLTGHLRWDGSATVHVYTPVAGQVVSVPVDIGDLVKGGDPLARIDSPDFGQARADARTAGAALTAADRAYSRTKDLFEHGAAAEKDVDASRSAYAAAAAERDRAEARLRLYHGMDADSGSVFVLRAPVAGVVVERNVAPGQEVRADQMLANDPGLLAPLFVVSDPTRLWVQVDVPETELQSLQTGQALRIRTGAFPDREFEGTLDNIGPTLDPATRTVKVRGIVRNPDRLLKAEMYVSVDVVRDESRVANAGVLISAKAVFMLENRYYLFVETSPGAFERRQVVVGTEQDSVIPVTSGLAAGERVVVEGALLLQSVLNPAS